MKKAKYQWLKPQNDFGVACESKILTKDYIIHDHDHYEIEIYLEGSLHHWLNGTVSTLSTGDFYLLSPQDTHFHCLVTPQVRLEKILLYLPRLPEALQRLVGSLPTPLVGHFDSDQLGSVLDIISELQKETSAPLEYSPLCIASLTALLLVHLLRNDQNRQSQKQPEQSELFRRATDYISAHFRYPITLSDVAKEFYLSPTYFSNAFTKHIGCSFVAYLTRLRVFHAQKLLVTTNMSITEIAADAGFNTFSSFSRAFKLQAGLSPVEYRKKYQSFIKSN